jgi:CofD-related protein of GAK system
VPHRIPITRAVRIPDERAVARCRRAPELGPRILFFSGGSALRPLSRILKQYTHNSRHLITAFDSGGSSAHLRRAFGMLSIGDLRNRLLALADETQRGNPAIYRLFSHRLPRDASADALAETLGRMAAGSDPLVSEVPPPLARLIRTQLGFFESQRPRDFDLRGASIGNLVLAGAYLSNERDIESVVFLFSQLVEVRGLVLPIVDADLHLAATLETGERIVGQHLITRGGESSTAPIARLELVADLERGAPAAIDAPADVVELIEDADLVCYPMGSFYSSVLANLLPRGVGRAIAASACPKVFVPSTGVDPEQRGLSVAGCARAIIEAVRRDAGEEVPIDRILNVAILDADDAAYAMAPETETLAALGVHVAREPLSVAANGGRLDPQHLTELLLSLS